MLTFNHILEAEGINPAEVHLIRHKDQRCSPDSTPYHAWLADDGTLEGYQSLQVSKRFQVGKLLASFVVTPSDETLFVGLYGVDEIGVAGRGEIDPILGIDVSGMYQYEMTPDRRLDSYVGRLVIDWGSAALAYVQYASRNDKPVVAIRDRSERR